MLPSVMYPSLKTIMLVWLVVQIEELSSHL